MILINRMQQTLQEATIKEGLNSKNGYDYIKNNSNIVENNMYYRNIKILIPHILFEQLSSISQQETEKYTYITYRTENELIDQITKYHYDSIIITQSSLETNISEIYHKLIKILAEDTILIYITNESREKIDITIQSNTHARKFFVFTEQISGINLLEIIKAIQNLKGAKDQYINFINIFNEITDQIKINSQQLNTGIFNFKTYFEELLLKILNTDNKTEKPDMILTRVAIEEKHAKWYLYQYKDNKLEKNILNLTLIPKASDINARLFHCNGEEVKQQFKIFIHKLQEAAPEIDVRNMTAYLSNRLSIFCINYGRETGRLDALSLKLFAVDILLLQDIFQQFKEIDDLATDTIKSLATISEVNDEYAGQHMHRFGLYCKLMAEHSGMSINEIKTIEIQSQLHDVGKIYIPQAILHKIGKLTQEEWEVVKMHTIHGARIIGDHPRMKMAKNIALTHHELWNGTGYPNGLKGEEIPLEGRIAALADTYDTLRMIRSYKESYDHATACRIILEGDEHGSPDSFDPRLLLIFKQFHWQFNDIFEANQ